MANRTEGEANYRVPGMPGWGDVATRTSLNKHPASLGAARNTSKIRFKVDFYGLPTCVMFSEHLARILDSKGLGSLTSLFEGGIVGRLWLGNDSQILITRI